MNTIVLIYNGDEITHYKSDYVPLWSDSIMVDEARYIVTERIWDIRDQYVVKLVVKLYDENED